MATATKTVVTTYQLHLSQMEKEYLISILQNSPQEFAEPPKQLGHRKNITVALLEIETT